MRQWLVDIRKGKSTYRMAEELGIPQSTYWALEKGIINPSVKSAKELAKKLGVNWTLFFEEPEEGM